MATHSKIRYRIHPASWLIVLFSFFYDSVHSKADTGFSLKENKKVSKIPFQLIDNLIVIDLKLNQYHSVKAIFDTGVRSIILYGKKFKKELAKLMYFYNENRNKMVRQDNLNEYLHKVDDIKGILGKNITMILEREGTLDDLMNRSDQMLEDTKVRYK